MYNAEARDFDLKATVSQADEPPSVNSLDGAGSLFDPLCYNEEVFETAFDRNLRSCPLVNQTMLKIASAFGYVEHFSIYQPEGSGSCHGEDIQTVTYITIIGLVDGKEDAGQFRVRPYPHDGLCSPNMDTNIWEVKWSHRDDCVTALTVTSRCL